MSEDVRVLDPLMKDARGKLRSDFWTVNDEPSKTVQSDAHLAVIQEIMKAFGVVGMEKHLADVDMKFMDVSEFSDYTEMMMHVRGAEGSFMQLPSKIREKFDHDVFKWLDAAHHEPETEAAADVVVEPKVEPDLVVAPEVAKN